MKKFAILTAATTYLTLPASALATDLNVCGTGTFSRLCGFNQSSFGPIIYNLINLIFVVAVVAALLYLIWGGVKWITSGGDKQGVASAREHIVAAIVGLVIVFLSYFILNIVLYYFLGVSLSNLQIPTLTGA